MAPPASTTPLRAWTISRPRGRSAARSSTSATTAPGAAAIGLDQLDAAVGVDVRAGGDRVGQERGARRPLGVERAAHAAVAEPRAALDAAADQLGLPAELARRRPSSLRLLALTSSGLPAPTSSRASTAAKCGSSVAASRSPMPWRSAHSRSVAGGRAERRRPVDGGAAADVAALQDHDREILGRAVAVLLVERRIRPRLLHVEVGARVVAALLDDGDLGARRRQHRGGGAAARAAADDREVDLVRRHRAELRARRRCGPARARRSRRHLRHHRRARVADARVHLGRRVVGGVRQPLERLVPAAQHGQARSPPGLDARVLLGGRRARERPRRRRR